MYSGKGWGKKKIGRKVIWIGVAVMIGAAFLFTAAGALPDRQEEGDRFGKKVVLWAQEEIKRTYLPVFAFVEEETGRPEKPARFFYDLLLSAIPLYRYSEEGKEEGVRIEDENTYDLLIRLEGTDEEHKDVGEDGLEYEEDALHIDGDLQNALLKENSLHNGQDGEEPQQEEEEMMPEESGGFRKAEEKSYQYDWDEVREYEDIVSAFYAIDSTTSITDEQLNLENLLGRDMSVKKDGEKPQILIYHTHSQEAFVDSVEGDVSTTIVGAGERLAEILREEYGFSVLHHTGEYDVTARDYAYSNSLPALEQLLAENPSIEVVIDLHRDAVPEGKKLMVELQGRPTAQFMFFNGLSRTRQNGDIDYLENPYVNDNLAFSFQAQVASNEYYPGVARRIYLKAYRYNMHLRARCMLIELGAQTNTVEEIMNACDPLAHVIAKVLSGETGDVAREAAGVTVTE